MTLKTLAALAGLLVSGTMTVSADDSLGPEPEGKEAPRESSPHEELRIAYFVDAWDRADRGQIHALLETWAPAFTTPQYPTCEIQVLDNENALAAAVRLGKFDAVFIYAYQMPTLGKELQLAPGLLVGTEDSPQLNLVLLARRNTGIEKIGDLEGKSVFIDTANLGALPVLWLGHASEQGSEGIAPKPRLGLCTDAFNAIAPVFFGKADACITTQLAYSENAGLNPQVQHGLRVIASSPAFTTRVLTFPPKVDRSKKSALLALRPPLNREIIRSGGFLAAPDLVFHDVAEGDFSIFKAFDHSALPSPPGVTTKGSPALTSLSEPMSIPPESD